MGVFLYEHGFVPVLKEVTCSPVPLIESLRVESIQLSHADRKVAIRGFNENVIAHEAVSVTNPVVAFIDPNKSVEKVFAILIVLEDRFPLVTAAGDVINSAWVFYPEGAYYIGILSRCGRNIKTKDLTLILLILHDASVHLPRARLHHVGLSAYCAVFSVKAAAVSASAIKT